LESFHQEAKTMNNRRNFLKIAGTGLTASLLQPFQSNATTLNTKGEKVKIGVLLPQSTEHPHYSGSFLNGLRSGIDQHSSIKKNKIELIIEPVNTGTPYTVKEKTQKLISENNVDLVVGVLNSEVASQVGSLFKNAKLPAIIANTGESYLVSESKKNDFLFFNSLNLFQAAYHSGKYAVEKFGQNVAIITSLYDGGYDALFTFRQGVETAGGQISEIHLASQNDPDFISATLDKLQQSPPDCIYLFMHGNESDEMIRNLHFSQLNIPLITTAYSTEENRLVNLGEAAENIISISSWNRKLENKENKVFVDQYLKNFRKYPDLFSVLGYETGLIIHNSLSRCAGDFSGEQISKSLKTCAIESPRGKIRMNEKSGMVNNQLVVNQAIKSVFGFPENRVIDTFNPISEFDEQFASLDNDLRSGWLNPYLFV
jgi:branched-chain amino acid transport system substrate-binding protein